MKKLMIVIFIFIILLAGKQENHSFSLLDYFSGEYTAYTSSESGEDCVDLGFCYMNSKPITNELIGESIIAQNLEVGSAIKVLKARVVKTECLEDGTNVIYAFTSLINDKVKVDGENVNLQIATRNDTTVIGWPLILGSF